MDDGKTPVMKIVIDGKERDVSLADLALSNNLAQEALVRLLVDKKIIDGKELYEYLQKVKAERYRTMPPDSSSKK